MSGMTDIHPDAVLVESMLAKAERSNRRTYLPKTLPAQLTPSEREALQKAVSTDYLEERGLREGSHGEIVNARGRTAFEVGFARAIRKILGK